MNEELKRRDKIAVSIGARIDMCVGEQRRVASLRDLIGIDAQSGRLLDDAERRLKEVQVSLELAREALR